MSRRTFACVLPGVLLLAGCASHPPAPPASPPAAPARADIARPAVPSSGRDAIRRQRLLAFHRHHRHLRWRLGADGRDGFIDCSAYVRQIYREVFRQRDFPRTAREQSRLGQPVAQPDLRPGDLLYFIDRGNDHTGVYVGEGEFIHVSVHKGVTRDPLRGYWARRLRAARRLPLP